MESYRDTAPGWATTHVFRSARGVFAIRGEIAERQMPGNFASPDCGAGRLRCCEDSGRYSFPYVASWAGDENAEAMVLRSGQRIVRATNVILDALLGAGGGRLEESERGAA